MIFLFLLTIITSNTDHKRKIIKIQLSDWMSYIYVECENNLFGIRKMYSELSLAVGGKIISQSVTGGGLMSLSLSFYITAYIRLDDSSNKNCLSEF